MTIVIVKGLLISVICDCICIFGNLFDHYMTCSTGITVWLGLISISDVIVEGLKLTYMSLVLCYGCLNLLNLYI